MTPVPKHVEARAELMRCRKKNPGSRTNPGWKNCLDSALQELSMFLTGNWQDFPSHEQLSMCPSKLLLPQSATEVIIFTSWCFYLSATTGSMGKNLGDMKAEISCLLKTSAALVRHWTMRMDWNELKILQNNFKWEPLENQNEKQQSTTYFWQKKTLPLIPHARIIKNRHSHIETRPNNEKLLMIRLMSKAISAPTFDSKPTP